MKWNERYKEYLTDESGLRGACEEIIFPSSSCLLYTSDAADE